MPGAYDQDDKDCGHQESAQPLLSGSEDDHDSPSPGVTEKEKPKNVMVYRLIFRPWRVRKPLYWSLLFELFGVVATLTLFAIAQPNTYRTKLWKIGYDNGFNSSPSMVLYAYANHDPLPKIPFVWTLTLTNFNVAISVLSLFILVAKMTGIIMKVYYPFIGFWVAFSMMALYITSLSGQAGPDYADPNHPSRIPWYIAKSCSYAVPYGLKTSCMMAKGCFAASVYMLCIYIYNVTLSVWSLWPNKMLDYECDTDSDSESDLGKATAATVSAKAATQWEMRAPMPLKSPQWPPANPMASPRFTAGGQTPMMMTASAAAAGPAAYTSPFTPRTQAFHTLDRTLPLRA